MKRSSFFLLCAIVLLAVCCTPSTQQYTVNGSIAKHPMAAYVDSVYLVNDLGESAKSPVVDGKFSFEGEVAKPILTTIVFTYGGAVPGKFSLPLILEEGNIHFLGLPSKRFAGTPLNDSIVMLNTKANEVQADVIDEAYYDKLAKILRTYIKNNPNDASTVYALREGVNSDLFTEEEIWELLQVCGVEVNTTNFAKEICAKYDAME
ncbi:MAG: DUF4369 domain-containing protein [Rikenellaceae bacterium]|nr:DUF4369 domain-containing protein [Rikenellaceae bacterium]